jgi:hypothetical protein
MTSFSQNRQKAVKLLICPFLVKRGYIGLATSIISQNISKKGLPKGIPLVKPFLAKILSI